MSAQYKYHLRYKLEGDAAGFTKDEVPEGFGACNAGVFISLLYPPDGSYSFFVMPVDGRNAEDGVLGELSLDEEWKAWYMWSLSLAKKLPVGGSRQLIAQTTFEAHLHGVGPEIDIEAWRKAHGLPNPRHSLEKLRGGEEPGDVH
jgi:hypothetical protein